MKIKVKAHPNSKKPRIETKSNGELHVYIKEPAKENKANEAVVQKLSDYYKVPKSKITLKHGEKSKIKLLEIEE
jgi:uncharacterized protein YggU (UPF0235/DUF167 family)